MSSCWPSSTMWLWCLWQRTQGAYQALIFWEITSSWVRHLYYKSALEGVHMFFFSPPSDRTATWTAKKDPPASSSSDTLLGQQTAAAEPQHAVVGHLIGFSMTLGIFQSVASIIFYLCSWKLFGGLGRFGLGAAVTVLIFCASDLTARSLEMMASKGDYPEMTLWQVMQLIRY